MEGLLHYCYLDELPSGLEAADVVKLLEAAAYYGTPRQEAGTAQLSSAQLSSAQLRDCRWARGVL